MADPRDVYQAALVKFGKAESSAQQAIKMINDVGRALQTDLASFMGWQFQVTLRNQMPPGGRFDSRFQFDLKQWPDAEILKSVLFEWATAREQLEAAWHAMSPEQQVGFTAPPKTLKF